MPNRRTNRHKILFILRFPQFLGVRGKSLRKSRKRKLRDPLATKHMFKVPQRLLHQRQRLSPDNQLIKTKLSTFRRKWGLRVLFIEFSDRVRPMCPRLEYN